MGLLLLQPAGLCVLGGVKGNPSMVYHPGSEGTSLAGFGSATSLGKTVLGLLSSSCKIKLLEQMSDLLITNDLRLHDQRIKKILFENIVYLYGSN